MIYDVKASLSVSYLYIFYLLQSAGVIYACFVFSLTYVGMFRYVFCRAYNVISCHVMPSCYSEKGRNSPRIPYIH